MAKAVSTTLIPALNNSRARAIRILSRYACGGRPIALENVRATWKRLREVNAASCVSDMFSE
jgi:hypothetical protein